MQSDRIDSLAVNFWRTTLKIFNAADFGIVPNEDISEKLAEFISALKAEDGERTAVFDSGTYHITVDPKLFMSAVTPYLAAFYALVLNLGYGFFCGLLLFLINLSGSRVLSFAVLSGYENNNLRAGKERQPLCRQFNLQKNKMIDMIIALQYNEAVKSGIGNI